MIPATLFHCPINLICFLRVSVEKQFGLNHFIRQADDFHVVLVA